jgi:hypothetical protein
MQNLDIETLSFALIDAKKPTKVGFLSQNSTALLSFGKFNYRDADQGAKHSNTCVLRAFATPICALKLDLTTLKIKLHIFDHYITKTGARHLCSAFHQAGEVISDFLGSNRTFGCRDQQICRFQPAHVTQHHFCGQNQ